MTRQQATLTSLPPALITEPPACTICNGSTAEKFSKPLGTINVGYYSCSCCGHLTAGELDSNPNYDDGRYFAEIDTGWEERNRRICKFVSVISRLPGVGVSNCARILDFGCGAGKLVQDLNTLGFDAYGFEPYPQEGISAPVFANLNEIREMENIDLITCIEVLEHLRNPDKVLALFSELLGSSGYLMLSTELYNSRNHGENWYYLNPAAGHVSIFNERSLRILLRRHSFEPILRINLAVWLFRKSLNLGRLLPERLYFALSQCRVKLGIRLNYQAK